MNIALPTLVVLLGLLPGITFFYGYFAGRFDKRAAALSSVEELALYVIFAIPIDVIALELYRVLGMPFNFSVALRLLSGSLSEPGAHEEVAAYFRDHTVLAAGNYFTVLLAGFVLGALVRRVVWASRWDVDVAHLRLRNDWFYVLQGRVPDMPRAVASFADVLTRLPDLDDAQTRLYRGLVVDFSLTTNGCVDSLTLARARRGTGRGKDFAWRDIPSNRLVLMGGTIHSINITYFAIAEDDGVTPFRRWWRSFRWQTP